MKLQPKFGIDKLLFGMKQQDVKQVYGEPDSSFKDEEDNVIFVYNQQQVRLTFYQDESLRLGYIISAHPDLTLYGETIIGKPVEEVKNKLVNHQLTKWEKEDFDITENHFNEEHWLILQSEFGRVVKVEIGAIINDKDEFDWKY